MPYKIRKLPNRDLYRVYNSETKEIKAKATTLENAKKMVRLLHAVIHGWTPTLPRAVSKKRGSPPKDASISFSSSTGRNKKKTK